MGCARVFSAFALLSTLLLVKNSFSADGLDVRADLEPKSDYTAARKLGRGVANFTCGWMEVLKDIHEVGKENNPAAALTWGTVKGIKDGAVRTAVGAYEVATFAVGGRRHYEPILDPEFIFPEDTDQ